MRVDYSGRPFFVFHRRRCSEHSGCGCGFSVFQVIAGTHFDSSVPCEFMDVAVTDYYGYPLEQQTISLSSSSTEAHPFAKKLKSIPENVLVGPL